MATYRIEDSTLTAIGDAIRTKRDSDALIAPEDMASAILGIETGGGGAPSGVIVGEFTPNENVTSVTLTTAFSGKLIAYALICPGLEAAPHSDTTATYLFSAVGKTYVNRSTWQAPVTGVKPDGTNSYYASNQVIKQSGTTVTATLAANISYVFAKGRRYVYALFSE